MVSRIESAFSSCFHGVGVALRALEVALTALFTLGCSLAQPHLLAYIKTGMPPEELEEQCHRDLFDEQRAWLANNGHLNRMEVVLEQYHAPLEGGYHDAPFDGEDLFGEEDSLDRPE